MQETHKRDTPRNTDRIRKDNGKAKNKYQHSKYTVSNSPIVAIALGRRACLKHARITKRGQNTVARASNLRHTDKSLGSWSVYRQKMICLAISCTPIERNAHEHITTTKKAPSALGFKQSPSRKQNGRRRGLLCWRLGVVMGG